MWIIGIPSYWDLPIISWDLRDFEWKIDPCHVFFLLGVWNGCVLLRVPKVDAQLCEGI